MDRRLGGFAVPTSLHFHHEKCLPQPGTRLKPSEWKVFFFFGWCGGKEEQIKGKTVEVEAVRCDY